MAEARVAEKMSVRTHLGDLKFERYTDGEVIASLGGSHWFGINQEEQNGIARFLSGNAKRQTEQTKPDAPRLGLFTTQPVRRRVFKVDLRKEDRGWGVNVTASKRYYYSSRDGARTAQPEHKIGECSRVG